jgi:protein-L-isoaspartate(D-aspartate) O-methyltransferase
MRRGAGFDAQRAAMVERQLRGRGIDDERVLSAMGTVAREAFLPEAVRRRAYRDGALSIGFGQTISQPWVVAAICQGLALGGGERVLEVGTGSGYSAAVLARLAEQVVTIERIPELAELAAKALHEQGAVNVEVVVADGSAGLRDRGRFEAIAVHAAAPRAPRSLIEQLAPGGRLVVPIATGHVDLLTRFERTGPGSDPERDLAMDVIGPCRFVPLIGDEGFAG